MKPDQAHPLRIATPCPKNWDEMTGNDTRRFCEHCQLHVTNLSAMPPRERDGFVAEVRRSGESVCVGYELNPDGAPILMESRWSRFAVSMRRAAAVVLSTVLPFAFASCVAKRLTGVVPPGNEELSREPGERKTGEACSPAAAAAVPKQKDSLLTTKGTPVATPRGTVVGKIKSKQPVPPRSGRLLGVVVGDGKFAEPVTWELTTDLKEATSLEETSGDGANPPRLGAP